MRDTYKSERGITLIALVITIIVLLILAGIAISMLSGENGILNQAAKSKMQTEKKSNREKIQIAALGAMTNTNHKMDEGTLKEELKKVIGENAEAIPDGRNGYIIEESGKTIGVIDENGQVGEGKWHFSPEEGEELIITDGETKIEIGDEINYDCTKGEKGEEVTASYTSYGNINGRRDYTYNAKDYTGKWGILGVENGKILIMPMQNVTTNTKSAIMNLYGKAEYKNGVNRLNEISKIYGHGKGADGARSIKVEDVDKVTGYNPNNTGVRDFDKKETGTKYGAGNINEYGNEVTYEKRSDGIYYNGTKGSFSIFTYLDGENWVTLENGESKKYTCNCYYYYPETLTSTQDDTQSIGIAHGSKAYTMLFENTSNDTHYYFLGSFSDSTGKGNVGYGVRHVRNARVGYENLYFSHDGYALYGMDGGVRPAVSLKSDVQLTKEGEVWKIQ